MRPVSWDRDLEKIDQNEMFSDLKSAQMNVGMPGLQLLCLQRMAAGLNGHARARARPAVAGWLHRWMGESAYSCSSVPYSKVLFVLRGMCEDDDAKLFSRVNSGKAWNAIFHANNLL